MAIKEKIVLAMCIAVAGTFAADPTIWDGSADDSWYEPSAQAYNLTTAEQLAGLAKLVNEGTSDFSGKTITLGSDIFLNDTAGAEAGTWSSVPRTAWTPIGTEKYPFKGEFDGLAGANKKRKIYGLYFNDTTANYIGLFGYTNAVKISNLDILVGRVNAKNDVGALIGRSIAGTVTNVHAEVKVVGKNHIGGLVGYTTGSLARVSVTENISGQDSIGGVAGFVSGNIIGTAKSNCYFIGKLEGRDWVGGIVGRSTGDIKYAYHQGGDIVGNSRVGGIAGETGVASNSPLNVVFSVSSEGVVQGKDKYVGGIVGYSQGTVDSASHKNGTVSSATYVGGIAGYAQFVNNSHKEGFVSGTGSYTGGIAGYLNHDINNCYHVGDVNGEGYVGGLVGSAIIIRDSYAEGDVTGTAKFVGGLVGEQRDASYRIVRSHVKGSVTAEKSIYVGGVVGRANGKIDSTVYHIGGDVVGLDSVGGVVGYANGIVDSAYHQGGLVQGNNYVGGVVGCGNAKVYNSYAEGTVKGSGFRVGGVIGFSKGVVDSCYHIQGAVSGTYDIGGVVGRGETSISNSYAEGDVFGTKQSVGGVAGYIYSGTSNNVYHVNGGVQGSDGVGGVIGSTPGVISNSYHENGDVVSSAGGVGGVAGYCTGAISNSYSIANVSGKSTKVGGVAGRALGGISRSYAEGSVVGTDSVGGLAGFVQGNVSYSHHLGTSVSGRDHVGGLAGYAVGQIDSSYHIGENVVGSNFVGGLAGELFYQSDAQVTFDGLKNSYAEANVEGVKYVGGLIGRDVLRRSANNTKSLIKRILNSYSKGNVSGESSVGGVIGEMIKTYNNTSYTSNMDVIVNSCYHADGSVSATANRVGGVVGYTVGSVQYSNHTNGSVLGVDSVGGVVGYASGSLTNVSFEGDVTGRNTVGGVAGYVGGALGDGSSIGNVSGQNKLGGVVGHANGAIRNAHSEGKVLGKDSVGGVAGYAASTIDLANAVGDSVVGIFQVGGLAGVARGVVDSSYASSHVKGDDNVGGLIGSSYANISSSYALGNVQGDVEHSSKGNDNLGGLVGYAYSGTITKSMALGNVSGTTKLGGLVGRFEGTSISQSYAGGNITGSFDGNPADSVGNYYIGGLVGLGKGTITEAYASGVVKGMEKDPFMTGCFIGSVSETMTISKSYYDETVCKLGLEGIDPETEETFAVVSGTPAQTTAAMQTQSTFEDWDFTDTWKIMENTYPFLQIYSNSLTNAVVTTQSLEGISYDGTAKTPLVTSVTLFGETLEYETEYTITYANNVNAGTASINVCGVMPYGGCKVVNFEIAGIAVEPTIAAIDNMTYTGRALIPEIEVYNGETLLAAADYSVEYKDNINVGTATVTVTMKGNYSGTASKTFEIEKATPVITQNPKAGDVVLGETLASSELTGGRANVDGEFVWKTPSTKPALENEGYAVIFVPMDTDNYTNSAEIVIPVKVLDMVYVAVHLDNTTIDSVLIVKGSNYTLPSAPDIAGSDFMGFYNGKTLIGKAGDVISIDENTVIDAVYKVQTFVITFMNGTTVLQSGEVPYGSVPAAPEVALPKNTAQYTYSFVGWDKEVVAVTEAATYNAIIDSTINAYEIVFVDFDGDTLKDSTYAYGTLTSAIEKPVDPTRTATAQYTYTFVGWNPTIADVTEDAIYTALFDSTVNVYEVVFVVPNDTLQSLKMNLAYGATPVYEGTPTKEATAQYSYTFKGWSPEIESVLSAATYTAVFDSTIRAYTITFVNGATSLQSNDVAYGVLPEYTGTTPTKEATAQYTYAFKSWTPTIVSVTGEATYAAVFDSVVNKYLITFKNGTEVVQSDSVAYGTIPERPEITLPKNTAQYTYSLSWDKDVVAVTGSATYIATIDSVVNKYDIVFKDYDGTVLKDSIYAYGTLASKIAKPADPARAATPKYAFTFKGWSPSIADVTADAVYTAVYDSTIRTYTITFKNGSETMQSSEVEYGVTPSYKGATPTKTSTKEYTYTFKGWNPAVASVSGAATYTAVFDSTIRKYTVTFMNGNVEMQTISVAYGTTPVYSGNTPTKAATDSCTYKFSGWNSELKPVTGDVTYTAKFEVVKKTFLVHFIYGSNTYQVLKVEYGEIPKYTGNTPAKKDTKTYTYEFVGWSPKLGPVTKETYYTAVFDSSKVTGMQNVRLAGLNMLVNAVSRNIQISAAPIGSAYAILDMQGRILRKGRVDSANFNVATPRAGSYIVRVGHWTQRVDVR